jgi:exodeoxyribonuclease VII small subunit
VADRQAGSAKQAGKASQAGKAGRPEQPDQAGQARPAYEQARDELTELVKRLEAGGLTLEQSLQLWERGERLAAICEDWLEGARARLAAAVAHPGANASGSPDTPGAPF